MRKSMKLLLLTAALAVGMGIQAYGEETAITLHSPDLLLGCRPQGRSADWANLCGF